MVGRSAKCGRSVFFIGLFLGLLTFPSLAWGSLRIGNADIQVFYAQQHAFQYDNGEYGIDWVQFRNELSVKFTYEKLVYDEMLFEQVRVPYVQEATFYTYYRGRFDPVYLIRQRYHKLFDDETRNNFAVPENEFRELFLDLDLGQVGVGNLSMRIGRQQIVWGESDLFRSLDIINPLKVDQNSLVGERFDDYRTPRWIAKFLYDIGNVGPFSEVGIEPFYTANWLPVFTDTLIPGASRLHDNDISRFVGMRGTEPLFRRKSNPDQPMQRGNHPWAIARQGANNRRHAVPYLCVFTLKCDAPQESLRGERISAVFNWEYDRRGMRHFPRGWGLEKSMAGVRILGKTGFGVDFTLNYLFKRTEGVPGLDAEELLDRPLGLATGKLVPRLDRIYGVGIPGQDLATGIARCMGSIKPLRGMPGAPAGVFQSEFPGSTRKAGGQRIGDKGKMESAILVGTDLNGYNANDNPDDDIGGGGGTLASLLGLPGLGLTGLGPTVPITACAKVPLKWPWTHVAAFTATYNDFDYTGAVFRLEQSYFTKTGIPKFPDLLKSFAGALTTTPHQARKVVLEDGLVAYTPVWKSMVGFDLIRSWASFPGLGWMRYAPLDIGTQTTFITGQFLTEYQFDQMSNNLAASTEHLCGSLNVYDKCTRWNMGATLAVAGAGYGKGKFEPLAAVGYDLTTMESVFVYRMFWHGLFGNKRLDFYGGTAVYMAGKNQMGWLLLQNFADKDVLWLRLIYYLI